ncbi:MAG: hypothetical protein WCB04_14575 [Mycobacteriales bacterium]
MIRSVWRACAVLSVLALLPLAAACEQHPGSAAFVGGARIADSRVQDLVDEGLRDSLVRAGVKDVGVYRGVVLSRLIKHEVIVRAAAKSGVKVTDGEVTQILGQQQQSAGGAKQLETAVAAAPLSLPKDQIEPFFRDLILLDKIGAYLTRNEVYTEAELRAFYDQRGGASVGPYDKIKDQVIAAVRRQHAGVATEGYVKDYLRTIRVTVNPRYGKFDASKFFDAQQAPVLKPAPDAFFKAESSAPPASPSAAPSP